MKTKEEYLQFLNDLINLSDLAIIPKSDYHENIELLEKMIDSHFFYKNFENQIYPTTLEELVNITVDMANKTEGKKANCIHLLSDEDSYKWERLSVIEKEIGLPLDVYFHIYESNNIYIIEDDRIIRLRICGDDIDILFWYRSFRCCLPKTSLTYTTLHVDDYNVLWFINYEDAEKKLNEIDNDMF